VEVGKPLRTLVVEPVDHPVDEPTPNEATDDGAARVAEPEPVAA
jgi:hypothetical protein